MKYLKYFEQASAYEAYKNGNDYVSPNVSYVNDVDVVYYNSNNDDSSDTELDSIIFYFGNGTRPQGSEIRYDILNNSVSVISGYENYECYKLYNDQVPPFVILKNENSDSLSVNRVYLYQVTKKDGTTVTKYTASANDAESILGNRYVCDVVAYDRYATHEYIMQNTALYELFNSNNELSDLVGKYYVYNIAIYVTDTKTGKEYAVQIK